MPNKFFLRFAPVFAADGAAGDPPIVPATPTTPWYQGKVDERTIGHWQNRYPGKLDDPVAIAIEATKSHIAAETLIGVPANQIVRLPTDEADEAGWKNVWARLGVPATAAEYDLKNADGTPLDPKLEGVLRETVAKANLPKAAASQVAASVSKILADQQAETLAVTTAAIAAEKEALAKNWGANRDINMLAAKTAAAALKVTPEEVAALESTIGYARVMEMFRSIGAKTGEPRFIGGSPDGSGVMSRAQAVDRKAELMKDKQFAQRYLSGEAAAGREMTALNTIIVGDDTESSRR